MMAAVRRPLFRDREALSHWHAHVYTGTVQLAHRLELGLRPTDFASCHPVRKGLRPTAAPVRTSACLA